MFDYHMHSKVSFDGQCTGLAMAQAAREKGLREICFTDHMDYTPEMEMVFSMEDYAAEYDSLEIPGLKIRRGVEYGLTPTNQAQMAADLQKRKFDFVLGSVHFVDELDVYLEPYWQGKTVDQAIGRFLETTLECVRVHNDYDVLGHLTFISKARANPQPGLIPYDRCPALFDEILRELVRRDKGLELNTSGIDRCGGSLPTLDFFRRFRELGGKIVTVGSDAHHTDRVGQYTRDMALQLQEIFGYVCTFEHRQPIFHKL